MALVPRPGPPRPAPCGPGTAPGPWTARPPSTRRCSCCDRPAHGCHPAPAGPGECRPGWVGRARRRGRPRRLPRPGQARIPKTVVVVSTRPSGGVSVSGSSGFRAGGAGVATYEQTPEGKTEHRIDGSGTLPHVDDSESASEDQRPEDRLPIFEAARSDWAGQSTPTPTGPGDSPELDLSEAFLHWPPRSVADTDPFDFGINTGAGRPGLRLNPYVPRDVDAELDSALASP